MRPLFLVVAAFTAFAFQALSEEATPPPAMIQITDAGKVRPLDDSKQLAVKFWLQQLLVSALYRDVVQDSSLDEWQQRASSPSRIYCRYASEATLSIPERKPILLDAVLVPLPASQYPDYIYVKHGQRVLRLTKYDHWVLYKLVSESGLSLYEQLSTVQRGLF